MKSFRHRLVASALLCLGAVFSETALACLELPMPPECRMTSPFGRRIDPVKKQITNAMHKGMDLACGTGRPVTAAAGGKIIKARYQQVEGNMVVVASGQYTILYMHNSAFAFKDYQPGKTGVTVEAGDLIAKSGSTGKSTGPHLHMQVLQGGKPVDPWPLLCSKPPVKEGVLDGASPPDSDFQATAASASNLEGAGAPLPFDLESGSLRQLVNDAIGARIDNPEYLTQMATLQDVGLYAEIAYTDALNLRVRTEIMAHRERINALHALILALRTEQALLPSIAEQRAAVQTRSSR